MEVRGKDIVGRIPRGQEITSEEIREALREPLEDIVEAIKEVLELTPPSFQQTFSTRASSLPAV